MNTRPQEALSFRDLARQQARISRQISLDQLPRVNPLTDGESGGPLDVTMTFSHDPDGLVRVQGEVNGRLALTCFGCAETLDHELALNFDCVIAVSDGLADQLVREVREGDVLVADGTDITLAEIVEDEILLGLPERLCRTDPCERALDLSYPAAGVAVENLEQQATDSPFRILAELKNVDNDQID